jgi:hypothetical protein
VDFSQPGYVSGVGVGGAPGGYAGGDGCIILEYIADMSYETKPVEKLSIQLRTSSLDDNFSVLTARPNSDTVDHTPLNSHSYRNDPESAPTGTDISVAAVDLSVPSLLRTYSLETRTTNPS